MPRKNIWSRFWGKAGGRFARRRPHRRPRRTIPESTTPYKDRYDPDPDEIQRQIEAQEERDQLKNVSSGTRYDSGSAAEVMGKYEGAFDDLERVEGHDLGLERPAPEGGVRQMPTSAELASQPPGTQYVGFGSRIYWDVNEGFVGSPGTWEDPEVGHGEMIMSGIRGLLGEPIDLPGPIQTKKNIPIYWDPATNTLTMRNTGFLARYGVQATPDEELQQRLINLEQEKELAMIEEFAKEQEIVANISELEQTEMEWRPPLVLKDDVVVEDSTERYVGVVQTISQILIDHRDPNTGELDFSDDPASEEELTRLIVHEMELRPWAIKPDDLVWIFDREHEGIPVELKEEDAAPWTSHADGFLERSLLYLLQELPREFGGKYEEWAWSDQKFNSVFGGPFWSSVNRVWRELNASFRETFPAVDTLGQTYQLGREAIRLAAKGISPGKEGAAEGRPWWTWIPFHPDNPREGIDQWTGFVKQIMWGIPGSEIPASFKQFLILMPQFSKDPDFRAANDPYIMNEQLVQAMGGSFFAYFMDLDDDSLAQSEAIINGWRESFYRWTELDPIDRVWEGNRIPEHLREEILGEDAAERYTTAITQNEALAITQQENAEKGTLMSYLMQIGQGVFSPEVLQIINQAAHDSWTKAYYSEKARTDTMSNTFRYTWSWDWEGADLEKEADEAIVDAMIQKGRFLQPWEREAVTDRFTKVGPELGGEIFWDWFNIIPGQLVGDMARGVWGGTKNLLEGTLNVVGKTIGRGEWGSVARNFLGEVLQFGAIQSRAQIKANAFNNALLGITHAVGSDMRAWGNALIDLNKAIADDTGEMMARFRSKYRITQKTAKLMIEFAEEAGGVGTIERILANVGSVDGAAARVTDMVYEAFLKAHSFEFEGYRMLEEGFINIWQKADPNLSRMGKAIRPFVKGYLVIQKDLLRGWAEWVLTMRPSYTVINHVDNTFRAVINGANFFTRFDDLIERNRHWLTTELTGPYAKHATVFGGRENVATAILNGELAPTLANAFRYGWNNFDNPGLWTPMTRWTNAWASVNTMSELVSRLRVFDNLRLQNIRVLRPAYKQAVDQILSEYPEELQLIAKMNLLQAVDNPVRFRELMYGRGGIYSNWIGEEFYDDLVKVFGEPRAQNLVRNIGDQMYHLQQTGQVTPENIQGIVDDIMDQADVSYQRAQQLARDLQDTLTRAPTSGLDYGFDWIREIDDEGNLVLKHLFEGIDEERTVASVAESALMDEGIDPTLTADISAKLAAGQMVPDEYFKALQEALEPDDFDRVIARINERLAEETAEISHAEDLIRAGLVDDAKEAELRQIDEWAAADDAVLKEAVPSVQFDEDGLPVVDLETMTDKQVKLVMQARKRKYQDAVMRRMAGPPTPVLDDVARQTALPTVDNVAQSKAIKQAQFQNVAGEPGKIVLIDGTEFAATPTSISVGVPSDPHLEVIDDVGNFVSGEVIERIEDADGNILWQRAVAEAEDVIPPGMPSEAVVGEAERAAEVATQEVRVEAAANRTQQRLNDYLEDIKGRGGNVPDYLTDDFIDEAVMGLDPIAAEELSDDLDQIIRQFNLNHIDQDQADALIRLTQEVKDQYGQLRSRTTQQLATLLDNMILNKQFEGFEQAKDYLYRYMQRIQEPFAGSVRRFNVDIFPGPRNPYTVDVQRAWQEYFEIQARIHRLVSNRNSELIQMLTPPDAIREEGGQVVRDWFGNQLEQLAGRWNDGFLDLPTWSEAFSGIGDDIIGVLPVEQHLGYDIVFNSDGTPLYVAYKSGAENYIDAERFFHHMGIATDPELTAFGSAANDWRQVPIGMTSEDARKLQLTAEELAQEAVELRVAQEARTIARGQLWGELLDDPFMDGLMRPTSRRGLYAHMFGEEALESPEAFREAATGLINDLRASGRIAEARHLEHQLLSMEAELSSMLRMEGYDNVQLLGPIRRTELPPNIQTALKLQDDATFHYVHLHRTMTNWGARVQDALETGEWFTLASQMGDEAIEALAKMGDDISAHMDDMLKAAQDGGEYMGQTVRGAVSQTNEAMIDYAKFGTFDRWMKENLAPFWMFPRHSLPMWLSKFLEKPWMVSMYHKYMRGSERWAYIKGAIDRRGNPIPSLRGYYPLPFSDRLWFNPTAAFSARYAIPNIDEEEQRRFEDDMSVVPLNHRIGSYLMRYGRWAGLNFNPVVTWVLFNQFDMLDENRIPQHALVPQLKLVPPIFRDFLTRALRMWSGPVADGMDNFLDPKVGWKDFLVEYQLLQQAVQYIRDNPNMSQEEKTVYISQVRSALMHDRRTEDTPEGQALAEMYREARLATEQSDWYRNSIGYFTGIYFKEFTTAKAEFNLIRRRIAMLQQSLNNEAMTMLFDLPLEPTERWNHYLTERYELPDGLFAGMYNQISFVRYPDTEIPAFGQDRRDILAEQLLEDEETQMYYQGMENLFNEYDLMIEKLGVGAPYEATKPAREFLSDGLARLDELYPNHKSPDYIGYKPDALVFDEWVDEIWKAFQKSMPQWNPGLEDWNSFEQRQQDYIDNIQSMIADFVVPYYKVILHGDRIHPDMVHPQEEDMIRQAQEDIQVRFPDLNIPLPDNLKERLYEEFTPVNYEVWRRKNHSAYDALMQAWKDLVWTSYWDAMTDPNTGKIFSDQDAFHLAQQKWNEQWGEEGTATDEQLIEKVQELYGERFSPDDLQRILDQSDTYSPEDRIAEEGGEKYQREQEMWDLLHLINPGKMWGEFNDIVDVIGQPHGINSDDVGMFMSSMGHSESFSKEKWDLLVDIIRQAVAQIDAVEPTEVQLQERIDARVLQDQFKSAVTSELGEDWFQLQTYWYTLDRAEQQAFKEQHPEAYERLQKGWDMRDVYAVANPMWAKYYHKDVYEAVKQGMSLDEAIDALELDMRTGGRVPGSGYARRGGGLYGGYSQRQSPDVHVQGGLRGAWGQELLWKQHVRPTQRSWWPAWLLETMGEPAADKVEEAAATGEPIDQATMSYLKNLDNNEQRDIVKNVEEIYRWLVLQIKQKQAEKAKNEQPSGGGRPSFRR